MTDVTLYNGREITFDLNLISRREFLSLLDKEQKEEEGNTLVGKTCGLSGDDVSNLGYEDWRRLMKAFYKKATSPLDDPND